MMILTIRNKKHLFINKPEDDFLRFMPKRFGCKPEEIGVEVVDESAEFERNRANGEMSDEDRAAGVFFELEILADVFGVVKHEPPTAATGDIDVQVALEEGAEPARIAEGDPRTLYRRSMHLEIPTHGVTRWPYLGEQFVGVEVVRS